MSSRRVVLQQRHAAARQPQSLTAAGACVSIQAIASTTAAAAYESKHHRACARVGPQGGKSRGGTASAVPSAPTQNLRKAAECVGARLRAAAVAGRALVDVCVRAWQRGWPAHGSSAAIGRRHDTQQGSTEPARSNRSALPTCAVDAQRARRVASQAVGRAPHGSGARRVNCTGRPA